MKEIRKITDHLIASSKLAKIADEKIDPNLLLPNLYMILGRLDAQVIKGVSQPCAVAEDTSNKMLNELDKACLGGGQNYKNIFLHFDEMCWIKINEDLVAIEWKMRYSHHHTKSECLLAAQIIAAYKSLIEKTNKRRNYIANKIKDDSRREA